MIRCIGKTGRQVLSEGRSWILPSLATVTFLLMLTHKSESPVVFGRYGVDYSILLGLTALNVALLWRRRAVRLVHDDLTGRRSRGGLIALLVVGSSMMFLFDFVLGVGLPRRPAVWVNLALLGMLWLQVEFLDKRRILMSGRAALVASSLAVSVMMLEAMFSLVLLETRTPKTEGEFLRLMTSESLRKQGGGWREYPSLTKPPETFRILGLADSFGTAGGTSNYHYLLEGLLRRDGGSSIEMINISVPGSEPAHHLAILRFGMSYAPELVLHGFFVGNDFYAEGEDRYVYRNIAATRHPNASRYRPAYFLSRVWMENAVKVVREEWRRRREEEMAGMRRDEGTFSKSGFAELQFRRMNAWAARNATNVDRMREVFPLLDGIRRVVEQGGARYAMVVHPDQTQVDERLREEIVRSFHVNPKAYDLDLPQELLRWYCGDRKIPCLDLLPIFRRAHGEQYSIRDTHYNSTGNELAARSIRQFLYDAQLVRSGGVAAAAKWQHSS